MAASLLRSRHLPSFHLCNNILRRHGFIVLIPEIPEDTPDTNPLLQTDGYPKYRSITAENCLNGVGKLSLEYEAAVHRLEDQLRDLNAKREFSTVIEPLERQCMPLYYAWGTVKLLQAVKNNGSMKKAATKIQPTFHRASSQRYCSVPIYNAIKEIHADRANLTEPQRRVVNKFMVESRLAGVELQGYNLNHFNSLHGKLQKEKNLYRFKVQHCTDSFYHTISDHAVIQDLPDDLRRIMSMDRTNPSLGPWRVTLHQPIYSLFMDYCNDRDLRWNAWNAYNTRASQSNIELSNSIHMEEIRSQRQDLAKLLGYKNFVELSMETKMAGHLDNVKTMIASLKLFAKPAAEKEIDLLQEFATSRGFNGELELWDIPYWRRKQRHTILNLDEFDLQSYFPLPKVLDGLFKLCHELFGITIKNFDGEAETWHDDVKFFKVFNEQGHQCGSFFLDPYARTSEKAGGIWTQTGRIRSDINKSKPIDYISLNLAPPLGKRPALMTFDEVRALFHEFGHCLQDLLTLAPHMDVAGTNNIEWDAVEICSTFMENWVYDDYTLQLISSHMETGNPLPVFIADKLRAIRCHMAGYDLLQQLYLSALDMEFYSRKDFWLDLTRKVWSDFMILPLQKQDVHPCSFSAIFSGDYPASYYSYKWAEMNSSDIFCAFMEVGLHDRDKINALGRRFRDTFLALGGGCHPGEVFRRFRGRDPSPNALLMIYGLKKTEFMDSHKTESKKN